MDNKLVLRLVFADEALGLSELASVAPVCRLWDAVSLEARLQRLARLAHRGSPSAYIDSFRALDTQAEPPQGGIFDPVLNRWISGDDSREAQQRRRKMPTITGYHEVEGVLWAVRKQETLAERHSFLDYALVDLCAALGGVPQLLRFTRAVGPHSVTRRSITRSVSRALMSHPRCPYIARYPHLCAVDEEFQAPRWGISHALYRFHHPMSHLACSTMSVCPEAPGYIRITRDSFTSDSEEPSGTVVVLQSAFSWELLDVVFLVYVGQFLVEGFTDRSRAYSGTCESPWRYQLPRVSGTVAGGDSYLVSAGGRLRELLRQEALQCGAVLQRRGVAPRDLRVALRGGHPASTPEQLGVPGVLHGVPLGRIRQHHLNQAGVKCRGERLRILRRVHEELQARRAHRRLHRMPVRQLVAQLICRRCADLSETLQCIHRINTDREAFLAEFIDQWGSS